MKVRPDALIAVGAALRAAQDNGVPLHDVARVSLDGAVVDAVAAVAALDAAGDIAPPGPPGLIGRALDRLEARAQSVEDKLERSNLGKRMVAIVQRDPERVSREGRVEIELRDGRKLEIPVVIVSRALSAALQRVSITSSALSLTPLVGSFVVAGTALASGLAALIAAAVGDGPLAKSLAGMAAKHGALLGMSFVPVMSSLTSAIAIVVDRADLKELRQPPSVADIVNLASFAPPSDG